MSRAALLAAVVLAVVVGIKLVFFSHAAGSFVALGTLQPAALQPTAWGRTIEGLAAWNGKIYAGYGDYNYNSGPIALQPFDPVSKTFASTPENAPCGLDTTTPNNTWRYAGAGCADTEELDIFRVINGNLYAPYIDPRYNTAFYSEATKNPTTGAVTWTNHRQAPGVVSFQHSFDITTLTGSDLWQVGSIVPGYLLDASGNPTSTPNSNGTSYAVAWRSLDGGATWTMETTSLVGPTRSPTVLVNGQPSCGLCDVRYYMAGVFNKPGTNDPKLILQAEDIQTGLKPFTLVYDSVANSWSKQPPLPYAGGYADQFAGKMISLGGIGTPGGASSLESLDYTVGSAGNLQYTIAAVGPEPFIYYTIDNSGATPILYALGFDGVVYSTKDLVSWYNDGAAPTSKSGGASSIAVLKGVMYVGGTDSRIYSAQVPASPTPASSGGGGGKPCHGHC